MKRTIVPDQCRRATGLLLTMGVAAWCVAAPLDPPTLRCASVNVAGDVTITWSIPPDPNGTFAHYEVYQANSVAGPFNLLANVAVYAQTNFYHAGADADAGPRFYYMRTVNTAMEASAPSDTVATLFLQVFQSTPEGSANLAWNAPAMSATATPVFSVWREYPIGNWALLTTVDTTTFALQHVVDICSDSLTFRIGLADASGCVSFSDLSGDHFEDVTPPSVPVVIDVTVDTLSGLSNITWSPSPETDTQGYIIVLQTPGGGVVLDTVWGHLSDTYEWLASTADLAPESFTVAAFDTCYTGSPPSPNTTATGPHHTTMHLTTTYDHCGARILLQWTPYGGWPVEMHQVYRQIDGGPWALVANEPGTATTASQSAEPGHTYCFVVRAVTAGGTVTSLSSGSCTDTHQTGQPMYNYLRTVTVTAPNIITVVDSVDPTGMVQGYRFERSENGAPFEEVYYHPGNSLLPLVFHDPDVDPDAVGYRYRVVVVDICGRDAITSNIGGQILLRATSDLDGTNTLQWNGYQQWAGETGTHRIHRSVDDGPFTEYALAPADPWTWTDNVNDLLEGTGRTCYYVEAIETANPSGIQATSVSNIACAVQEELVFIPNAFVVGGANPIFLPVMGFVDLRSYHLEIMNRWGQVIWYTNDPYKGWDGRVDGRLMPIGVYAYHLQVTNGAGKLVDKRGTVTLLTAFE